MRRRGEEAEPRRCEEVGAVAGVGEAEQLLLPRQRQIPSLQAPISKVKRVGLHLQSEAEGVPKIPIRCSVITLSSIRATAMGLRVQMSKRRERLSMRLRLFAVQARARAIPPRLMLPRALGRAVPRRRIRRHRVRNAADFAAMNLTDRFPVPRFPYTLGESRLLTGSSFVFPVACISLIRKVSN